jgi:hypothetical protein
MLIAILILLVLSMGTVALGQHAKAKVLENKLARLSATDNEIMCILEATDTPLAKKLLASLVVPAVAQLAPPSAPVVAPSEATNVSLGSGSVTLAWSEDVWPSIRLELGVSDFDDGRVKTLKSWLRKGYRFTDSQRIDIMKAMDFDSNRERARELLDKYR